MDKKARRRMKLLMRMMPKVAIDGIMKEGSSSQKVKRDAPRRHSPEAPPEPGHAKMKRVAGQAQVPLVDFIDLDDESEHSIDEGEVENWIDHRAQAVSRKRLAPFEQPVRERDLIDRMLSRTTRVTKRRDTRHASTASKPAQHRPPPTYYDRTDIDDEYGYDTDEPRQMHQQTLHDYSRIDRSPQKKKQRLQKDKRVGGGGALVVVPPPADFVPRPALPKRRRFRRHKSTHFEPPSPEQTTLDDWDWLTGRREDQENLSDNVDFQYAMQQKLRVHCGVPRFREGVEFAPETWIGSGRLAELQQLSHRETVPSPSIFVGFGLALHAYSEPGEVVDSLPTIFDSAYGWLIGANQDNRLSLEAMRFLALYLPDLFGRLPDVTPGLADSIAEQNMHLSARVLRLHECGGSRAELGYRQHAMHAADVGDARPGDPVLNSQTTTSLPSISPWLPPVPLPRS